MRRWSIAVVVVARSSFADPAPPPPLEVAASGGIAATSLNSTDGGLSSTGAFVDIDAQYHLGEHWSVAAFGSYARLSGTLDSNGYHIAIMDGGSDWFVGGGARGWFARRWYGGLGLGEMWTRSNQAAGGNPSSQSTQFVRTEIGVIAATLDATSLRVSAGIDWFTFDDVSRSGWIALGVSYR